MLVALVGKGTTSVVPVIDEARAWARTEPLRVKLTTGKPNPRLANPAPVIVKLAGGEARSTGLGVIELIWAMTADPVTLRVVPEPPVKVTLPAKVPAVDGLKRTVTV